MGKILDGFLSLGGTTNRVKQVNQIKEGVSSELLPELTLNTSDEDLIKSKQSWLNEWEKEAPTLSQRQKTNYRYWKGQFGYNDYELKNQTDRPEADNLIFQSLETFLPLITRQNPEPIVDCLNENQAKFFKDALVDLADVLKLKLKLRSIARHWGLSMVGVGKILWNVQDNRIDFQPINPTRLILDPNAHIEGGIYHGRFLGEYKKEMAADMVTKFPKKKDFITKLVDGKMATEVTYIEWWTNKNLFWTLKNEVLDKSKNPHWNYEEEKEEIITDDYGNETVDTQTIPGTNHLPYPQIPYAFLTVFTLGEHPWDDTSLIEQNLYLQDLVHKRLKQIDVNNDNINGGWVISGRSGLTADQATQATDAFRQGGSVYLPGMNANANQDIVKIQGTPLPGQVYESLVDYRNELRGIFGTQGSTPEGIQAEKTVRGKILARGSDDTRNSLVTEYLEQFTDYVFNWFVQMMYVYGPEEVLSQIVSPMVISMKEGSLIPKDPLTKSHQAIDLWGAGALSPEDLYKRIEEPDIEGSVQRLVEWRQFQTNPMMGLPSQGIPPSMPDMGMGMPPDMGGGMPLEAPQPEQDDLLSNVPII